MKILTVHIEADERLAPRDLANRQAQLLAAAHAWLGDVAPTLRDGSVVLVPPGLRVDVCEVTEEVSQWVVLIDKDGGQQRVAIKKMVQGEAQDLDGQSIPLQAPPDHYKLFTCPRCETERSAHTSSLTDVNDNPVAVICRTCLIPMVEKVVA